MKYLLILKQSIKGITANKVRSFLTILGIAIGIGSVIALVALVNGVKNNITDQISSLGTTTLTVTSGASRILQSGQSQDQEDPFSEGQSSLGIQTATLTEADYDDLSDKNKQPNIQAVSGTISGTGLVSTADGEQSISISGTTETDFAIHDLEINRGRLFNADDTSSKARVAVIGSDIAKDVFADADPLGQIIKISGQDYEIIGVLAEKASSGFSNPNGGVYVPYSSLAKDSGSTKFGSLSVQAKDENAVDAAKADIEKTLLANHGITDAKKADFSILTAKDLLSTISSITSILSSVLGGIAGISLVVGGIGIMNIMLVSVTERTREIGLRKAVGAKTRDILTQFLTEAVVLTMFGGLFGIALGYGASNIVGRLVDLSPSVTTYSILLAVGVSAGVGIIFGVYPAIKASVMNPIDALRYE